MRLIRSGFCTASLDLSPVEAKRFSALFRNDRIIQKCNALPYDVNLPLARALPVIPGERVSVCARAREGDLGNDTVPIL